MPTALVVTFKVKAGMNAKFEQAFATMQAAMRKDEPGALYYDLYRPQDGDAQTYVMLERYADEAAFKAHRETPHMANVLKALGDSMDGRPEAQLLELVSALK
jgi:quinol monooxygenase YgiN